MAISIESAELMELFLWKENEDVDRSRLKEELADVLAYCLLLADKQGFDVNEIVREKVKKNAEKYPVDKAKGVATKYKDL